MEFVDVDRRHSVTPMTNGVPAAVSDRQPEGSTYEKYPLPTRMYKENVHYGKRGASINELFQRDLIKFRLFLTIHLFFFSALFLSDLVASA